MCCQKLCLKVILLSRSTRGEFNTTRTIPVRTPSPRYVREQSNVGDIPVVLDAFRDSSSYPMEEEANDVPVIPEEDDGDDRYEDEDPSLYLTQGEPNLDRADREFEKRFIENEFGYACDVCARIWFQNDLKPLSNADGAVLMAANYFETVDGFSACLTCRSSLKRGLIPTLSQTNGFTYPKFPSNLPPLDPITTRLVSPRICFMQLRRLRHAAGL